MLSIHKSALLLQGYLKTSFSVKLLSYYWLIKCQSCHRIGINQLICSPNQLTGFNMMVTLAFNELIIFLMVLSVMLLSMLMISLSALSRIELLVCGNRLWVALWVGTESGLIVSVSGKFCLFHSIVKTTGVIYAKMDRTTYNEKLS